MLYILAVAELLNRDLGKVSKWCDLWGIKLNASQTKTVKSVVVYRPFTMHPLSPTLTRGGTMLKESDDLDILRKTFDYMMTFEKHLRSVPEQPFKCLVS